MNAFTESVVEQAALDWFRALGYDVVGGPDMLPGPHALRESYADTIFPSVVHGALARLNPNLPAEALDDAFRKLTHPEGATLAAGNRAFHRLAVDGVTVEYRDDGGSIRGAQVQVLDFEQPSNNDWLAVNQFTVVESNHERRPDIVLFVNGLPARRHRAQESGGRGRDRPKCLAAAPDVPGGAALAVHVQCGARRIRRHRGPARHPHCGMGVVQALAHHLRRRVGAGVPHRTPGGDRGSVREAALSRPPARLHRVRGRRRWATRQEDGGVPPVPRGRDGGRRNAARGRAATRNQYRRGARALRVRPQAGWKSGRPAHRRRVAYPGLRQEPDHGVLRRAHHPRAGDGQPHRGGADRPQRSRRSALRHLRTLPGPAAPAAGAGRKPGRTCAASSRSKRAASSSAPSRSSSRKRRATAIPCFPSDATSWSSPTRRTAASTTSSTASRGTCATRCPTRRSSASRAPQSSFRTPTPAPCSATTSASTTSSVRSRTGRRCRSTTRAGSRSWRSTRASGPGSTRASRRRPRARRSTARRSSRRSGRSSKPWSGPSSASSWSPQTSSRTSSSAPRPWTARRWSCA